MVHEDATTIPTPETDLGPDTPDPSYPLPPTTFYYNEHGEPIYTTGSSSTPFPPVIWPDPSGALPADLFLGLDLDMSMPLPMTLPMDFPTHDVSGAIEFLPYATPPPSTLPPSDTHYLGSNTLPLAMPSTTTAAAAPAGSVGMQWDLDPLAAWPSPPRPEVIHPAGDDGTESSHHPVKARKWMSQMNSLPNLDEEGMVPVEQGYGGLTGTGSSAGGGDGGGSSSQAAGAPQGRAGRKKKAKKDELMPYRGIVRGFQTLWQRDKGK
ncbi:hypothetical protein C8A05DRAFT_37857 [Staphylotrichum tortipilum]|uniref:Uncharacterized protein n=1 Tax=Staphylotrichum tortipilum TaxID=2831512 RepID=A0AAN6MCV1_9PEZI|nr:hypothetical protein C8A05DRAFT_37857 [Staphylotrichum longicolle]